MSTGPSTTVALKLTRLFRPLILSYFVRRRDIARSCALRLSSLTRASGNQVRL